jgi:hypothetical protein
MPNVAVLISHRELDEKISQMAENLTKKVDGLGEVLLLKTVPEADRKAVCNFVDKPIHDSQCDMTVLLPT